MSIVMEINPFEFFTDTNGDALDSGYIWVGEPNKDPRQYPVTAFYDEALTIPAAMPLRTSNGYIVRNGSPTFLYISGNYSIIVQDKNGRQIFYVPDFLMTGSGSAISAGDLFSSTDPAKGAGMVGYTRSPMPDSPSGLSNYLDSSAVSIWEFESFITSKPNPADPSTWDWLPALNQWVAKVNSTPFYSRALHIPRIQGGIGISAQWLVNASNIAIYIESDIRLTSATRQKTILFAYDTGQAPAQTLSNIHVAWAKGCKVDGNGSAMSFPYAHGDGSDNDSTIRFNRVDTFTARGVLATNGPIDSFSVRQCRNWIVEDCEFSVSKEDNGFSVTTDWGTYVRGDWNTYGFGSVVNCKAHDNEDFGMTSFNCSGVYFINCRSWGNRGGYSYEDSGSVPNTKYFDGKFVACSAYNCVEQGFYIDGGGVTIDDDCESYNIRGFAGDNTNGLFENGVVVSAADDVYVGGKHRKNGRSGVAIFNGVGVQMNITVNGEYSSNDSIGIRARGISRLQIIPGTQVKLNGNISIGGSFNAGINVSNSGGAPYLDGTGAFICVGVIIENSGVNGIVVTNVSWVHIDEVVGAGNCLSGSGSGISVAVCNLLYARHNTMWTLTGNQLYGLVISASVVSAYSWGNKGNGSTLGDVSNASPSRKGIDSDAAFSIGAFTPSGAYPAEGFWTTVALGNALSTLADSLQRNGILNKD